MHAVDWVRVRPAETIASPDLVLTRLSAPDVPALVLAVNESLDHLRPWMAWASEPATAETMSAFVSHAEDCWRLGSEFHYAVRRPPSPALVAGCGLHVRRGPGVLEIGYWVHVAHVRRGIATALAAALTARRWNCPPSSAWRSAVTPATPAAPPCRRGWDSRWRASTTCRPMRPASGTAT